MSLLVHHQEITADAAKRSRSGIGAKCSSDLLLHFDHALIPLRQIVREWQRQVVEKGQHLICPLEQVIEQVLGGALLLPSATGLRLGLDQRRVGSIAAR
jgi:hypothetical protein